MFPRVHATLEREIVNDYTLLYRWKGDGSSNLQPFLLMSHLDVVPVSDADMDAWNYEPFAGHIIEDYIYGRGKSRLLSPRRLLPSCALSLSVSPSFFIVKVPITFISILSSRVINRYDG